MKNLKLLRTVLFGLSLIGASPVLPSIYDTAVLSDNPVLYLPMSGGVSTHKERDLSNQRLEGRYYPQTTSLQKTLLPNGDKAQAFNGYTQYLEVPSNRVLSVRRGGALTLEAWIRPDVLNFPSEQNGYVLWAGKGESGQHEYAFRMYSKTNPENRPNRISGYAFNLSGGLGSGSYFQDAVRAGEWIHVVLIIQTRTRPGDVKIYKNGVLRDTTSLSQFNVVPTAGNAPLRIGTRDFASYFKGAIGKFAIYAYPLTGSQILNHYQKMRP